MSASWVSVWSSQLLKPPLRQLPFLPLCFGGSTQGRSGPRHGPGLPHLGRLNFTVLCSHHSLLSSQLWEALTYHDSASHHFLPPFYPPQALLSFLPGLVPRQPHPPSITIPVQTCSAQGTDVAFVARARASSSQPSALLQYLWHRGPFLPLFKERVDQESLGGSSSWTGDAAVTQERAPRRAHRGGRPGAQQNWVQREELEQQGLLLWPLSAQQHPQGTGMIQNLLGK